MTRAAVGDTSATEGECGVDYEDVLKRLGAGRYQYRLLCCCCLLILSLHLDLFSLSVVLPPVTCDLALTAEQAAILSAMPLAGILVSSWSWGLAADLGGRRSTLLVAMTVGCTLSALSSLAPEFISLCVLKFFSAAFQASANAACYALAGEMTPASHRNYFLFAMVTVTMTTHFIIALIAIPVLSLTFRVPITWLTIELRPWRLLLFLLTLPGVMGVILLFFCRESTKFLLSKGRHDQALEDLRYIYSVNNPDKTPDEFKTQHVRVAEENSSSCPDKQQKMSRCRLVWEQTAPLFRPPLLRYSLVIYYIMLTSYMTSTGYSMWVPSITNLFFSGESSEGRTFCEVVESPASTNVTQVTTDCDHTVDVQTLYSVMVYSGVSVLLNTVLSAGTGRIGRRRSTQLVMTLCTVCGLLLYVARVPLLILTLFYGYLYVYLVIGALNSYIVELYPTHLRSMATCISVMVARGSGLLSVNTIALVLPRHCAFTVGGFVALVASGGVASCFLPPDKRVKDAASQDKDKAVV